VPVDLDRAGDVAGVVEQHVLVGLDHHEPGFTQVLGQPLGGDQALRVGVGGQFRVCVVWYRHGTEPSPVFHRSVTMTPTSVSSRRTSGRLIPITFDGPASMPVMNRAPSPSSVNPPAPPSAPRNMLGHRCPVRGASRATCGSWGRTTCGCASAVEQAANDHNNATVSRAPCSDGHIGHVPCTKVRNGGTSAL